MCYIGELEVGDCVEYSGHSQMRMVFCVTGVESDNLVCTRAWKVLTKGDFAGEQGRSPLQCAIHGSGLESGVILDKSISAVCFMGRVSKKYFADFVDEVGKVVADDLIKLKDVVGVEESGV